MIFVSLNAINRWTEICYINLLSDVIHITTSPPFIHAATSNHSVQSFRVKQSPISGSSGSSSSTTTLESFCSDEIARDTITHVPITLPALTLRASAASRNTSTEDHSTISSGLGGVFDLADGDANADLKLLLCSDRTGTIFGLKLPHPKTIQTAAQTCFEITLPQCVVKFVNASTGQHGGVRPPWNIPLGNSSQAQGKNSPKRVAGDVARGILKSDILGVATDGTLYHFSIVDHASRLLLKFLENLIRWHDVEERAVEMERVALANAAAKSNTTSATAEPSTGLIRSEFIIIDPEIIAGKVNSASTATAVGPAMQKASFGILSDSIEQRLVRPTKLVGTAGLADLLKKMLMFESPRGMVDEADLQSSRFYGNDVETRVKRFRELVWNATRDADETLGRNGTLDAREGRGRRETKEEPPDLERCVVLCLQWLGEVLGDVL